MRRVLDSDGDEVTAGSVITFSFGIPPVFVAAKVVERGGKLIALTPDYNPKEAQVSALKRNYIDFWVCKHVPKKAALDDSVHCIRCGTMLSDRSH